MRRRELITSLASTIAAWPFAGLAQTASKVYRIGFLSSRPLPAESSVGAAILRGFARHGYVPDRNMALEMRAAEGHPERLPQLAKDLVANNVDVILTFSFPAATAAKNATTTIPIVATLMGGDPVATGLVKSFSRPNGNITGVSDMAIELAPKRLELLKDLVPTLHTVAMEEEDLILVPYAVIYRVFFVVLIDVAKLFATMEELFRVRMSWGKLERAGRI